MKNFFLSVVIPLYLFSSDFVIVTATIGEEYKKITLPGVISKINYCKKHGYDFFALDHSLDISRPIPWSKILIVKQLLSNYKYVFWSDADSIILNQDLRLENVIKDLPEYNLHICFDNVSHVVNSGQFLIKQSYESEKFLDDVYNCHYAINHGWWENKAIIDLLCTPKYKSFAKIHPQKMFNSFGNKNFSPIKDAFFSSNDFIIHFPAAKGADLNFYMSYYGKDFLTPIESIEYNQIISNKN